MSLLRDRTWRLKYTPEDGDLVRNFYLPALRSAVRYDRTTGYFTAGALALAARGLEGLVLNDGHMRLIVGCTLNQAEADAIERGEAARVVVERQFAAFPPPGQGEAAALELLAWMVAHDRLDIRIALPRDPGTGKLRAAPAIFHEKTGVVEDKTGDKLAFNGSVNESWQGWTQNWESFHVFCAWDDGRRRVEQEEQDFQALWENKRASALVCDVPTAVREGLLQFLPPEGSLPRRMEALVDDETASDPLPPSTTAELEPIQPPVPEEAASPAERRRAMWENINQAATTEPGGERVGEATGLVTPWPHQIRAFERLYRNWPPRLLIADEVGLGKTIQAGLLLRQGWMAGRLKRVLVLAPKSVCKQWQIELREKFNLSWPIYDGAKLSWPKQGGAASAMERAVARSEWSREPFVIMSSHLARRRDRQGELLQADPWDLIVLDEAHHARRRGAGSSQEKGANALLSLMRELTHRTDGLLLLSATPMQVHPVELYDLLSLLGLPEKWTADAFEGFFRDAARDPITPDGFDRLADLFQAAEARYGENSRSKIEGWTGLSTLKSRRIANALRDSSTLPRRALSAEERRAAQKVLRRSTPVAALMSRNTRDLLRRYQAAGKSVGAIATRKVDDVFIALGPEERAVYDAVERYISLTYDKAAASERNAVGFVMTIYRRRLASSFNALRRTLEKRLAGVVDETALEEDIADALEAGEDLDAADAEAREKALHEESATLESLLLQTRALGVDSKALKLLDVLSDLREAGYRQAIVFTQFTDTLDFLRDLLAGKTRVICFSGRGGEVRNNDGTWKAISREDVKRRFREDQADLLLCTDAAAEGLNFQFCGALVNYDLPWNPMRVEQRIGRIDRLGQKFADIRIVNLHYANTVEADVYMALRARIDVFENVVGGLQPILNRLPKLIEASVLSAGSDSADRAEQAVRSLDQEMSSPSEAIDLADYADDDLELPPLPEPALTLNDLERLLHAPELLPSGVEVSPLGIRDFRYSSPELGRIVRVTVNRSFFDEHGESVEFWSPGSPTFPFVPPS